MRPRSAVRMMKRLREGCNARALAPASCGAAQQTKTTAGTAPTRTLLGVR